MSDARRGARGAAPGVTKVLWVETPSNPLLKITDIAALDELAHEAGAIAVVDNTFASPALQQPLALGADVVVHSTTKYLGGHSDVLGGALVVNDDAHPRGGRVPAVRRRRRLGSDGCLADDARHQDPRAADAAAQRERAGRRRVGLAAAPSSTPCTTRASSRTPATSIAARQMSAFGGMVSLSLAGGPPAARAFAEATVLFQLAESLGGVESLIGYPAEMTHASVRGTDLAVPENIVRLSVGIEDAARPDRRSRGGPRAPRVADRSRRIGRGRRTPGCRHVVARPSGRVSWTGVESIRRPQMFGGRASCSSELRLSSSPSPRRKGFVTVTASVPVQNPQPTAPVRIPTSTGAIRTLGPNPATAPIMLHPGDAIPNRRRILYIVLLGALTALGPFTIDLYLPGVPRAGGGLPDDGRRDPADPDRHDDRVRPRPAGRRPAQRQGRAAASRCSRSPRCTSSRASALPWPPRSTCSWSRASAWAWAPRRAESWRWRSCATCSAAAASS